MPVTTRARKNFGDSAERLAALHLEQQGYRILAATSARATAKLTLSPKMPPGLPLSKSKRAGVRVHGAPEEAITPRKQLKLVQLGDAFIAENEIFHDRAWRIDVVAVELDRTGKLIR